MMELSRSEENYLIRNTICILVKFNIVDEFDALWLDWLHRRLVCNIINLQRSQYE